VRAIPVDDQRFLRAWCDLVTRGLGLDGAPVTKLLSNGRKNDPTLREGERHAPSFIVNEVLYLNGPIAAVRRLSGSYRWGHDSLPAAATLAVATTWPRDNRMESSQLRALIR
jgi:hypothetical protein